MPVPVEEGLPPTHLWPERVYTLPETRYPVRLNVATEFLDVNAGGDRAGRTAIRFEDQIIPWRELQACVQDHVKRDLAPYKYPRQVTFVPALPRTETGKIRRAELRQQEAARMS